MSTKEEREHIELLQGTLDRLILRTLAVMAEAPPCRRQGY
jgi:hypothetical protein